MSYLFIIVSYTLLKRIIVVNFKYQIYATLNYINNTCDNHIKDTHEKQILEISLHKTQFYLSQVY